MCVDLDTGNYLQQQQKATTKKTKHFTIAWIHAVHDYHVSDSCKPLVLISPLLWYHHVFLTFLGCNTVFLIIMTIVVTETIYTKDTIFISPWKLSLNCIAAIKILYIGTIFYMQEICLKMYFSSLFFYVSVRIWNGLYMTDSTFLYFSWLTTSIHGTVILLSIFRRVEINRFNLENLLLLSLTRTFIFIDIYQWCGLFLFSVI